MTADTYLGAFQTEDGIRLSATFKNFAGVAADLTAPPTLKIYNADKVLLTTIAGTSLVHPSTGYYYYDYTTSATEGIYYAEFAGTGESVPISRRGYFFVGFV